MRQDFLWVCWDKSRLSRFLRFVKTFWDLSRYLDIIKMFWRTSGSKILTNWEMLIVKNDKINSLLIEIETNCWDFPKMSGHNRFLYLDRDFWDWKVVSRQNWDFLIEIKTSWLSRQAFWNCQDFLDRRYLLSASVEIESLNQGMIETNQDPLRCPTCSIFFCGKLQNYTTYTSCKMAKKVFLDMKRGGFPKIIIMSTQP